MPAASIVISQLTQHHKESLVKLLANQRPDYLRHFHPFVFSKEGVCEELLKAAKDQYWAFWDGSILVGFFMLRGMDAGYTRPSFGVMIDEAYSGQGLAGRALEHALQWCGSQNIHRVMLKVAPDNFRALSAYLKAGFVAIDTCKQTGQHIMEANLDSSA